MKTKMLRLTHLLFAVVVLASSVVAVFPQSQQVSAASTTYASDTDIVNKMKAVRYFAALDKCKSKFKKNINGSDIDKGPRWWVDYSGTNENKLYLGTIVDSAGTGGDGVTSCNGENDTTTWLANALQFFGLDIGTAQDGSMRQFLVDKLGYRCTQTNNGYDCNNESAENGTEDTNSWISKIAENSPYLDGRKDLLDTSKQEWKAVNYVWIINVLGESGCGGAPSNGSSNLANVSVVDITNGSAKVEKWSIPKLTTYPDNGNRGLANNPDNNQYEKCNEFAALSADYIEAYRGWLAYQQCSAMSRISGTSNLMACVAGWLHQTDYSYCGVNLPSSYRACAIGQRQPDYPAGEPVGVFCQNRYPLPVATPTYPGGPTTITGGEDLTRCIEGAAADARGESAYCKTHYMMTTPPYNEMPSYDACAYGLSLGAIAQLPPVSSDSPTDTAGETSCAITGIGWIVCSVMTAVAGMNDLMYEGIENILLLNPLAVQENGVETPTYQIWKPIRDLANALLVVAFLIIIFSQITNLGVTNYGIKKTLPRIIIVAIAINVSFFVMMIAIDLVNILGSGLHDLISQYSDTAWNAAQSRAGWGTVIDAVLGGTAVAATVGIAVAVSSATAVGMMVLPFLLGAVLAIFAAFVTLALRNALVVVLAIIAPLAFAAFLLPNTKKLYDKWQKLLVSMLFLFPMAALLFSGAKLAGAVIMGLDGGRGTLNTVFGLFIAAAPLFMLPWLAKSSGGILAKVGGQLGKMGKSLQGSAQKGLSPMVQQRKDERRRQLDAGERTLNPFGKVRTPNQTKETAAYKKMKEDFKEGKRAGESTADWDSRRRGLIQGMGRLSQSGDRSRTKQTIAQRLALGRAERESNISRLKKQPAEQLKAMADESGRINSVTGLTNLDSAGYSRGAQRLAQRAASTIETERLSDARAQTVDTRSKTGFEARHREGVILDSKAAEASLKTEQDRTGKLVEELSTEAGAALNPGLQAAASELHIAHTESQVAQMATDSAKRVATQEFADQIIQPASGLAARAGGIDQQGEARAVSKARAAVASAREESIGNIVNDHKLRPERSARWHLARLGDQDAIEKLRAEGLGALADEIGLLPPPTEEEETASIRRIKDIGGIGEALSLARLTPRLRTDQARDEAKGVVAPKLGERMPAFLSQMGNMSNAANNPGGLPIFSEEDAWVKYVDGTSFSLEDFITLPQQRDELIKFATENAASMTPGARQDVLRQLQDMRRQIEQSALAKEKIAPKAIENLDTALQQLENPPAPQQQP